VVFSVTVLAVVSMMCGGSGAAFSKLSANPVNGWTTGTVSLTDDDSGAAVFSVANLMLGDKGVKCIVITYGGTLAAAVKLYATGYTSSRALGAYLELTVEEGSGSSFVGSGPASCPGFVASSTIYHGTVDDFATTSTSYGTGVGSFAPTGAAQTRVFRFSYTLEAVAPNGTQSGVVGLGFTWAATA
jgi:hypothetical protein